MSDIDSLQTYYTLLSIEEEATAAEVRKAYLRRAAECHPDKHPEDDCATERFQALGEAYECLKDPTARKEYDLKLYNLRQQLPDPKSPSQSPPRSHGEYDFDQQHQYGHHGYSQPHGPLPPHAHHLPHGHTFFRATGFSPFPPFPRAFQHPRNGVLPPPLAMFAEFMSSLPGAHGLPKLGPIMFDLPFGLNVKSGRLGHGPFGPTDPFAPPFRLPFSGLAPPPPPLHFRQRPSSSHRHNHHPYPFPQGPAAILRPPGHMMPHPGCAPAPPSIRMQGAGGISGRCHRATFEIKDPAGRTTGFVHQSTMSWGPGFR